MQIAPPQREKRKEEMIKPIREELEKRGTRPMSFKALILVFLGAMLFLSPMYLLRLFPGCGISGATLLYKAFTIVYFLIVPIWFLLSGFKAVLRLLQKKKAANGFRLASFLLIALLFSLLISSQIASGLPTGSFDMKFDSNRWIDSTSADFNGGKSVREMMLGDLIKNFLPGKCKDEIMRELGPSLETPYFQSIDKDLIYYMGPERGHFMNIDSEWLLIWLDDNGCFEKFMIAND